MTIDPNAAVASAPAPPALARGLAGVRVATTRLSRVDGERGQLLIAGFPVEALAPCASFEETLFLLWNDRLPRADELAGLRADLAARRALPPATRAVLRAAAEARVAPMDALRMAVATWGLADLDLHATSLQTQPDEANQRRALRLVAAVPVAVAAYHRLQHGLEPVSPDASLDHASSFLHLLAGEVPSPARARALTTYLNTAVDHGMNASTFAARVIASTRSDLASAVVGALGALKGPLHGGAPGPALDMVFALERLAEQSGRPLAEVAERHVRDELAKGARIMGFGHRVYRVRDPRADVLGRALDSLAPDAAHPPLVASARVVEEVVLRILAEQKPHRPLQTNVEFYTALLLHGLGLPASLFTPTFAVARVAGWTAHVLEQIRDDVLIRPAVAYAGAAGRRYTALAERTAA